MFIPLGISSSQSMAAGAFTAQAVTFDGTTDVLQATSPMMPANNKQASFSGWFRRSAFGVSSLILLARSSGTRIFEIKLTNVGNVIEVIIANESDGLSYYYKTNSSYPLNQWNHVLMSLDGDSSATAEIWLNDVKQAVTNSTFVTGTDIPYNLTSTINIGQPANLPSTFRFAGSMSEIWFTNTFIDFDIEANRRKFIQSDKTPANLGANGSTPTGVQPIVYISGDASVWNAGTNAGSSGNFVMTGSVVDSIHEPVDAP